MIHLHHAERSPRQMLRDAAITLATVLLAFAAFDDITTDSATTFIAEWLGLAVCAVWLVVLSWRLLRSEHRWLGVVSVVAVIALVGAGSAVRPGTSPVQIEYLATIAGLLWFMGLAGILASQAWRTTDQHAA